MCPEQIGRNEAAMQNQPYAAADLAALGREWIGAWNSHDLERILALYAEDAEMTSDRIQALGLEASAGQDQAGFGEPSGALVRPPPSLRAQRSNPSHGIKKKWIASSLRSQ
jgi:hypothetical protein